MSNQKRLNALGLCRRAGRCVIGDFAAEKAVKSGKAALVILDEGASEATRARYTGFCERANVPLLILEDAGHAVGRPESKIIAVTDQGFAGMILAAEQEDRV